MENSTAITSVTEHEFIRAKLLDSPLFFTRYFFKHTYNRKFVISEHHKEICRVIKRVFMGDCKHVIINMPPRYGKTELLVKTLISMGLALNPKSKFIHTSYSETLALDNSESVKDLVESDEYQRFFDVQLKKDSKSKRKWYTNHGGGIYATSSGGQITGFGAGQVDDEDSEIKTYIDDIEQMQDLFNGAIIIDDPIKPEDADSPLMVDKINNRFDNTIRSRTNSRNTPIIIVMQRVGIKDLSGYLKDKEPDKWEVLEMPAINEQGKPLWEFKHTIKELEALRIANVRVFDTQYQQNPRDVEGKLFQKEEMNFFKLDDLNTENRNTTISFVDVADQGLDSLCMPVGELIGDMIYIIDVIHSKEGSNFTIPLVAGMIKDRNVDRCVVESNAMGYIYGTNLQERVSIELDIIPTKGNKHHRIVGNSAYIKKYFVFRNDYEHGSAYDTYMREIFAYTKDGKADHDDAPDATTGLALLKRELFD